MLELFRICVLLGRTLPDQASVQDPMKPKACPSCLVAQALGHQLKRNPVWAGGMRRQLMNGCVAGWLSPEHSPAEQGDTPGFTSQACPTAYHYTACPQVATCFLSSCQTCLSVDPDSVWSRLASVVVNFPFSVESRLACCSPIES